MEGKKFDKDKMDWSLIDLKLIEPLIPVLKRGEEKYGYENWKKEFENGDRRFHAAMMRHAKACQYDPLKVNKEDDCYHLAQVAINALFRLYHALEKEQKHPANQEW